MKEILANRVGAVVDLLKDRAEEKESTLLKDALDFFYLLRDSSRGLRKKPATAELLGWLLILNELGANPNTSLRAHRALIEKSLSTLVKNTEDQPLALTALKEWK
jgi:hypothetical protein